MKILTFIFCAFVLGFANGADFSQNGDEIAKIVYFDKTLPYAKNSKINNGFALLYKGVKPVIAINAGHGTKDGWQEKTLANPLGLPKLTNGTNKKGDIYSLAVSKGAKGFKGGLSEAQINLKIAKMLKTKLLNAGYGVLMLRSDDNARLDNIARALLANKHASVHISLHFDATKSDSGVFCVASKPEFYIAKNLSQKNNELCEVLLDAFKNQKIQIKSKENFIKDYKDFATYDDGKMFLDLTQSAYSSIPNVTMELGDLASHISEQRLEALANALLAGIEEYFNK